VKITPNLNLNLNLNLGPGRLRLGLGLGEGAFGGGRLGEGEVVAFNAGVDGLAGVERAFEDFLGRGGIRS